MKLHPTGLAALALFTCLASAAALQAQPGPPAEGSDMTAQLVDSRKGYVMRIPAAFRLDSNASGWSRRSLYELRVYRIPGVGILRITCTVKPIAIPRDTVSDGSYVYNEIDSATERGNAIIRTFFLPTRSVRVELIPLSIRMSRYLDAAHEIFLSFRWKPGAAGTAIDTDPPVGGAGR